MSFYMFWSNDGNLRLDNYLYNTRHILVIVAVMLFTIAMALIFYKKSQRIKNVVMYIFVGILIFFEISSRVVNLIFNDTWTFNVVAELMIPMYICSVIVWVFIISVFVKKTFLYNFVAIGGLLATSAFLAYPAVGLNFQYMTFTCLYSTISHSISFCVAILLIVFGFTNFRLKDIWKTYLCFAIMFIWGVICDFVLVNGFDHMFLINDPLELNLPVPHQLLYGIILAVYIFIFYFIQYLSEPKVVKMRLLQKQKAKINGESIIYHGRIEGGLKEIIPHKCKHDKAYVYGSENIALCIIFSIKRRGEGIDFGVGPWGKTYIKELYDGAFEDRFAGRNTNLYKLAKKDFAMKTEYLEVVSENPVKVIECEEVPDGAEYLKMLEKKKQVKIYRYKDYSAEQKAWAEETLIKAISKYKTFEEVAKKDMKTWTDDQKRIYYMNKERRDFCKAKFPELCTKAGLK